MICIQNGLRKKFNFKGSRDRNIILKLYHQFELASQVFLNGELVAEGPEHSNAYTFIDLDDNVKSLLKEDENIISVYCEQNMHRAYLDVGLYYMDN